MVDAETTRSKRFAATTSDCSKSARLDRLAATVAATIAQLTDSAEMPAESLYAAMNPERANLSRRTTQEAASITLPPSELRAWAWCTPDELGDRLPAHVLRRTRAALRARADGTTLYLENGRAA